jgi:CheY-like chemotaxis protein
MPNILWVDDEPQWLGRIAGDLPKDFHVITASTVADAVGALKAHGDLDVVVLDLMLTSEGARPVVGPDAGVKLLETIKNAKSRAGHLPVIAYSAYLVDRREDLAALGVESFISKSDTGPTNWVETIRRVISESHKKPAPQPVATEIVESIRHLVREEIEKFSPVRERTLHIPGHGTFELIKPLIGYKRDIEEQLLRFPYDQNVFLMMKFRDSNRELGEFIVENLATHGLRGVRADHDDWNITRNVYNPIAALFCCKWGIALFDEAENHQAYSANVAYELGIMHSQSKDCLILKHASLPDVPFDLIKDLHLRYERDLGVRPMITAWIRQVVPKRQSGTTG